MYNGLRRGTLPIILNGNGQTNQNRLSVDGAIAITSINQHISKSSKEISGEYSRKTDSLAEKETISRKLLQFKKDIERACKITSSHKQTRNDESLTRRLSVEFYHRTTPSYHKTMYNYESYYNRRNSSEDEFVEAKDKAPLVLTIDKLQDGLFIAQVLLRDLPTGDFIFRVSGYKIMIIIQRRNDRLKDDSDVTIPLKYGELDIPMYVDSSTITFEYDDNDSKLKLQAKIKGADLPPKCT